MSTAATKTELERRLAELYKAESAAMLAKRYKIGTREKEMADLADIRAAIKETESALNQINNRSYGTRRVVLMDF